jgi:Ca2+-binding RTX toxin-like protein
LIEGGAGNDTIIGGTGDDTLRGESGNDIFAYTARGFGNDVITDFETGDRIDLSSLNIEDFATLFQFFLRQSGPDTVISFDFASSRETITLRGINALSLTPSNFILNTSAVPIAVAGSSGIDDLFGGRGNDNISGGDGDDTIFGGAGRDTIRGGSGDDRMWGGSGDDTFAYRERGFGDDVIFDFETGDRISLQHLNIEDFATLSDFIRQSGPDTVISFGFTSSSETITLRGINAASLTASNFIFNVLLTDLSVLGSSGSDVLFGGGGNDGISGSSGDDTIYGGGGTDTIIGGSGDDTLRGGSGNDIFSYQARGFGNDVITDFATGDRIDLAPLNIGDFATLSDFIRQSGPDTVISFGFVGTSETITLRGINAASLTASNFIFNSSGAGLTVTGSSGRDVLFGGNGADTISGSSGNDTIYGGAGADLIMGGSGDDTLRGGTGNDALDGGTGFDAALYSGVRRQYVASSSSVSGNGEGTDTLVSIEQARFVDGVLTFDATSASAQVMRLYSATLNRVPDQGGLEANTGALASLGLQGLANTFVASAEFQARFGALNNQSFVEQLYQFALGRTGDPGGIANWVALLNGGASRGQVVVGFSESAENVGRTAATLNAGLWVPDQQALIIARLYDATFKRLPDVGGLTGWVNALKGGTSQEAIAAAFAGSAEFQATFGALSNQAFVEQLYRFCLNREGDAGGIAGWVNALNTGTSRASVLLGFSESAEHVALTAPLWLGGIRFAGFVGAPAEDAAKDLDGPQVLPDVEVVDIAYDPADLGLSSPDKDADAFVLPAVPDMPLPTVDPAAVFDGLDLAALRAEAFNNSRMMLILPEAPDATPDFDLDAWAPAQRDGYWLM